MPLDSERADASAATLTDVKPSVSIATMVRVILLVAGVCIIIASLRAASRVLAPLVGALFIALITAAPIPLLSKYMPRLVAVIAVSVVATAAIVGVGWMLPQWVDELSAILGDHEAELTALHARAVEYGVVDGARSGAKLPRSWMVAGGQAAFRFTTGVLTAIVLTGFMLSEFAGAKYKLTAAKVGERRRDMLRRMSARLTVYFRVKTLASAATGIVAGTACAAMGVGVPLLWGLLAFVLNYAPTIGSIVAAVPPCLLAGVTLGWEYAAMLSAIYLVINGTIGGVIEPKILGEKMGLSPLVILFSLVFWGWVWGPIGLLLAVPMTMVVKLVLEQTEGLRWVAIALGSVREAKARVNADRRARELPAPG